MAEADFQLPGYAIQRRLGDGGMATVFLAIQRSLDRSVAIKVMRAHAGDESEEKRFMLEARTLARLPHPNIVSVYDIAQNENFNYIVMEFLRGGVLSERMKSGLSMQEAISIIVQIADALQFAHDNGVIHRDLKPANVLFRGPSIPVLTDFGIARLSDADATRLTRPGMVIGTPSYMSPEQALGAPVDGRSDQYSLGVLFYEMLARKLPFSGETTMALAYHHVNTAPPPLPLRFDFAQPLIDKMMAKNPKDRYPDLKTFARELRTILTGDQSLQQQVLQSSPGQSDSERLRALGFSDIQMQGGGSSGGHHITGPGHAHPTPRTPSSMPVILPTAEGLKDLPPEVVAYKILEHSSLELESKAVSDVLRPIGEVAPAKLAKGDPFSYAKPQAAPPRLGAQRAEAPAPVQSGPPAWVRTALVGLALIVALLVAAKYL